MASADFSVGGTDQFLRLSKALKHAGRTELRKELSAGIRRAAKPLIAEAKAEARARLPKTGGLNERVAREPQRVQVRTGAIPGVSIVVGRRRGGARGANEGRIRHPVFGNTDVWVGQQVPSGWFDDTMRAGRPRVLREIRKAMDDVADQVIRDTKGAR